VRHQKRTIERYDPTGDAKRRWPDWHIAVTYLAGIPELIFPDRRLILVDPGSESKEVARAVAVAHLDLGHYLAEQGEITTEQQQAAETLAAIRLDREGSRE
jgi:hypothetical protein